MNARLRPPRANGPWSAAPAIGAAVDHRAELAPVLQGSLSPDGRERPPLTAADRMRAETIARELARPQLLDELFLEYQPIYTLATGQIDRVEALLRWRHPQLGVIPPLQFIPNAEDSGRIHAIGGWALATAVSQVAAWNDSLRRHAPLVAAVNVSAHQLAAPQFADQLLALLSSVELDPSLLLLEVVESSAITNQDVRALRNLEASRGAGVKIAIDDFGTGYSSLEYLGRLPVDVVKIDGVFVRRLSDPRGRRLFQGIVDLARALDVETVAEGIESAADLQAVAASRCTAAQGHLLSRPLPAAAVGERLRTRPHTVPDGTARGS